MTEMVEIEINDVQLADLLKKLDRLNMREITGPVFEPIGQDIQSKTAAYPAPVPGDVRTGHLGASWYHTVFPEYLKVGNLATYAGWVHGPDQRVRAKRRGWKQLLQTAKAELPELLQKLEARILAIWEGR